MLTVMYKPQLPVTGSSHKMNLPYQDYMTARWSRLIVACGVQVSGVLKYISASDIPTGGVNAFVQPEPLFATDRWAICDCTPPLPYSGCDLPGRRHVQALRCYHCCRNKRQHQWIDS